MQCILNDEFLPVEQASLNITDLGILRGYGIFDFFRTRENTPLFLEDHLDRFYASAKTLGLDIPHTKEELTARIYALLQLNNQPQSGIRLVLTGGYAADAYSVGTPNLIVTQENIGFPTADQYEKGVKVISHSYQRDIPEVKTTNYLVPISLKKEISNRDAFDVLYVFNGQLTELSRSNFFIVTEEGKIVTANKGVLKGVTRKKLIEVAKSIAPVEERALHIDELKTAKEAFLTGTTKKVLAIIQVDEQQIGSGKPGAITKQLMEAFEDFETEYLNAHQPG